MGPPQEVTGFRQGLKEFGYVEGQSCRLPLHRRSV